MVERCSAERYTADLGSGVELGPTAIEIFRRLNVKLEQAGYLLKGWHFEELDTTKVIRSVSNNSLNSYD